MSSSDDFKALLFKKFNENSLELLRECETRLLELKREKKQEHFVKQTLLELSESGSYPWGDSALPPAAQKDSPDAGMLPGCWFSLE